MPCSSSLARSRSCSRARAPSALEFGDDAGDLAGAAGGAIERLVEQAGEALEPLLDIVGARVERRDQRLDPGAALAEGGVGVAVAAVDQRDRFGERAAVGVELGGELAEVASAPCW